jgi:small subunit ribosomal protein S16
MAVKIRLKRMGKKRQPSYRVVVADGRSPRDGRFIEQIGRYDPLIEPSIVEIDNDRAVDWLSKGAQPTDAVRKLLEISGAWGRFKASKGEVYTIGEATAPKEKKSKKKIAAEAAAATAAADAAIETETSAEPEAAVAAAAPPDEAAAPEEAAVPEEVAAPEAAAAPEPPEADGDDALVAEAAEGEES